VGLSKSCDCIVVKFGGSVLENEVSIAGAVELVKSLLVRGNWVVVVVSAMKGVTDSLLSIAKQINPNMEPPLLDELLASGEKTSARLVAAALSGHGLKSLVIDPDTPIWPIITDDKHLDANPIFDVTRQRVERYLLPILKNGFVPVICGFLGKTSNNVTTTLGRGGSDTTAVLIGSCLGAKEVILIKDVEGVYSSDPDRVRNPQLIENLNGNEAELLAAGGAKFLHFKALRYHSNGMKIRVTSLTKLDSGTVIENNSSVGELDVQITSRNVSMLTLVGMDTRDSSSVDKIASAIRNANGRILSLSLEENSAIFYVDGGDSLLDHVHSEIITSRIAKAVSSYDKLSMVVIRGKMLETKPGVVQLATQPLAEAGINLYGIVTIHSSIRLFVSREQTETVVNLIKGVLEVLK
jgi:aspartate kinase